MQESAGADVYQDIREGPALSRQRGDRGIFSASLGRGVKNREGKAQEPVKADAY